jgi:hypothetical protein
MLDDVMRALGATWDEAEQAADFAAARDRSNTGYTISFCARLAEMC